MREFTNYSKAGAFTLAETLVTIAIIGIVAAITVPTLMTKYFNKAMDSKHKNAVSNISNGFKMMLAKEGVSDVSQLPLMKCDADDKACFDKNLSGVFAGMSTQVGELTEAYLISDETEDSVFDWSEVPYVFSTRDGITYGIKPNKNLKNFYVYADLNGTNGPDIVTKDMYKFKVSGNGNVADVTNEINISANSGVSSGTVNGSSSGISNNSPAGSSLVGSGMPLGSGSNCVIGQYAGCSSEAACNAYKNSKGYYCNSGKVYTVNYAAEYVAQSCFINEVTTPGAYDMYCR